MLHVEYADANNTEDDVAVIRSFGLPLRADDHGSAFASATALGTARRAVGVVERRTDARAIVDRDGPPPSCEPTRDLGAEPPRGPRHKGNPILSHGTPQARSTEAVRPRPASLSSRPARR